MKFDTLLASIRNGEHLNSSDFLPFLCRESKAERYQINIKIAEAYSEKGDYVLAKSFIIRAFEFSGFSSSVLPLFLKIHSAIGDFESIRNAYKRLGMIESYRGNVCESLKYFNLWQYTDATYQQIDKYEYDFDILERIYQMASPWRFEKSRQIEYEPSRKVKLAYLMFGANHLNSVLVKINRIFAKYHNKDAFEVIFFVPDSKSSIKLKSSKENLAFIENQGCNIIYACESRDELERLLSTAQNIFNYEPDVLITSAVLAEFQHYFIASLRPAPITVGLIQGPPQQFGAPDLDWCISWSKHPLIDTPCNCTLMQLGLDLPEIKSITPITRKEIKIPEAACVLMSAGRYVKFQNKEFLQTIIDAMGQYPDVYFIIVGATEKQIPFFSDMVSDELKKRIYLFGWRTDILNLFSVADIVIDTYPSGGGHVLIEAMSLGIPFISFENNYLGNFDQTDWSVADEFVDIPDLVLERGNFKKFANVLHQLITDKNYRAEMGKICKSRINVSMSSPDKSVLNFEKIILEIIKKRRKQKIFSPAPSKNQIPFQEMKQRQTYFLSKLKSFFIRNA